MQRHEGPEGKRKADLEQRDLTGRLLNIALLLAAMLMAVLAYGYWGI